MAANSSCSAAAAAPKQRAWDRISSLDPQSYAPMARTHDEPPQEDEASTSLPAATILKLSPAQAKICRFPPSCPVLIGNNQNSAFQVGQVTGVFIDLAPQSSRESLYTVTTGREVHECIPEAEVQFAPLCPVWFEEQLAAKVLGSYHPPNRIEECLYSIEIGMPHPLIRHGVDASKLKFRIDSTPPTSSRKHSRGEEDSAFQLFLALPSWIETEFVRDLLSDLSLDRTMTSVEAVEPNTSLDLYCPCPEHLHVRISAAQVNYAEETAQLVKNKISSHLNEEHARRLHSEAKVLHLAKKLRPAANFLQVPAGNLESGLPEEPDVARSNNNRRPRPHSFDLRYDEMRHGTSVDTRREYHNRRHAADERPPQMRLLKPSVEKDASPHIDRNVVVRQRSSDNASVAECSASTASDDPRGDSNREIQYGPRTREQQRDSETSKNVAPISVTVQVPWWTGDLTAIAKRMIGPELQSFRALRLDSNCFIKVLGYKNGRVDNDLCIIVRSSDRSAVNHGRKLAENFILKFLDRKLYGRMMYDFASQRHRREGDAEHNAYRGRSPEDFESIVWMSLIVLPSSDIVGYIVGKAGRKIKALRRSTGCNIIIEPESDIVAEGYIFISGPSKQNVMGALDALKASIEGYE